MSEMELTAFWEIWSEAMKQAETTGDVVFLECLDAGNSGRLFENLSDDKLKTTLSLINSILNDPKTRPKGLSIFADFLEQVNPTRLIGFQDGLTSGLHLAVKGLEHSSACSLLANFLPKCHVMNEVNQTVTSTVIPKILSHLYEEGNDSASQRTVDELMLLKVCLETYHGPCGPHRDRLEKVLVPLLDSDNVELIEYLSEVFPLLSYSGGGGNNGEKHIQDWNAMLNKFLKTAYTTLYELFGDTHFSLEVETPYDSDSLNGLKRITESKPLLRMTLLKRRLCNLLLVISGYLRTSFPAPKLIPHKGVLFLIQSISSLTPISGTTPDTTTLKEVIFSTAITGSIHVASLALLRSLIYSLGSNIFVEAVTVEQILAKEFKWIQDQPQAHEKLRLELYDTLTSWIRATNGVTTNSKTLSLWTNAIGVDSRIEKDVVEMKVITNRPGKSNKKTAHSSSQSIALNTTSPHTYVQKNWKVCHSALYALTHLIPGLDADNHRKIFEYLVKTTAIIAQFQPPPPPYNNVQCRKLLFENLTLLCFNPQPLSPVSLSLVISLLRKGVFDPEKSVATFCLDKVSILERLVHPIRSSMNIEGITPASVVVFDFSNQESLPEREDHDELERRSRTAANEAMDIIEENISDINQVQEKLIEPSTGVKSALSERDFSLDPETLRQIVKDSVSEIFKELTASPRQSDLRRLNSNTDVRNNNNKLSSPIARQPHEEVKSPGTESLSRISGEIISLDDDEDDHALMNSHRRSIGNPVTDDESSSDSSDIQEISAPTTLQNNNYSSPLKRVASPDGEEITEPQDDTRKRQKPDEENTGPSVKEMMSSFIDAEPNSC